MGRKFFGAVLQIENEPLLLLSLIIIVMYVLSQNKDQLMISHYSNGRAGLRWERLKVRVKEGETLVFVWVFLPWGFLTLVGVVVADFWSIRLDGFSRLGTIIICVRFWMFLCECRHSLWLLSFLLLEGGCPARFRCIIFVSMKVPFKDWKKKKEKGRRESLPVY